MKTALLGDDQPAMYRTVWGRQKWEAGNRALQRLHPSSHQAAGRSREERAEKKGHTEEARWRGTLAASFLETQTPASKNCQET